MPDTAQAEKEQKFLRSAGQVTLPKKPFPKIPDYFKQDPKARLAWEQYEREVEDWVKSTQL